MGGFVKPPRVSGGEDGVEQVFGGDGEVGRENDIGSKTKKMELEISPYLFFSKIKEAKKSPGLEGKIFCVSLLISSKENGYLAK